MATKTQICMALEVREVGTRVLLTWLTKAEDWTTAQRAARANLPAGPHIPQGVLFLLLRCSQPLKEDGHRVVLPT